MISGVWRVARRELAAYLHGPMGWTIFAVVLFVDGLLFNAFALGGGRRLSAQVLRDFFYFSSGTTMIAAVFLSMRLLAEERQNQTMVLLRTAPLGDWEVVLGKYLSALIALGGLTLCTVYMPLLVMVNGKVSAGHLFVGYLGLLCLGSASVAIGLLGSALAESQVAAAVLGAGMLVSLLVSWLLARVTEEPLKTIFINLGLFNRHFTPFMDGVLHSRDVVYYGAVTYLFLLLSVRVLAARRWS
jgi:ABC-2 type transport system permease protein